LAWGGQIKRDRDVFNYQANGLRLIGVADDSSKSRAKLAYREEFNKWQRQIEAILNDKSLTPEQRSAAITILRQRQKDEASAARQRVADEELQKKRAAQHLRQQMEESHRVR
jgi:hypothetical protein